MTKKYLHRLNCMAQKLQKETAKMIQKCKVILVIRHNLVQRYATPQNRILLGMCHHGPSFHRVMSAKNTILLQLYVNRAIIISIELFTHGALSPQSHDCAKPYTHRVIYPQSHNYLHRTVNPQGRITIDPYIHRAIPAQSPNFIS